MNRTALFFIGLNFGVAIGHAMHGDFGNFYYWVAAAFFMGIVELAISISKKERE